MKSAIFIIVTLSIIVSGCSTTTYLNLKQTYPESIGVQLNKVERDEGVGVEVSLLLSNGNEVSGELLSVRESTMTICSEYSATEEELANLTYPILLFSNNEIKELTIEGSNWIWEGIAAGAAVGIASFIGIAYSGAFDETETEEGLKYPAFGIFLLGLAAGWGIGYALSTEEYVLQEIPPDYNWSILKLLSRYPDKEPEYLRAIE